MASDVYMIGDIVRCDVTHYDRYKKNQLAKILGVSLGSKGNILIHLKNDGSEVGHTGYKSENFTVIKRGYNPEPKDTPVAYEKTKYFGMRLSVKKDPSRFVNFDIGPTPANPYESGQTILRDTKSEVLDDIKQNIEQGETWLVLQTVAKVTPADPRPPVVITDYK